MPIAIIGSGLAGLASAYFLRKESPDIEIDLFEAKNDVGMDSASVELCDSNNSSIRFDVPMRTWMENDPLDHFYKELGIESAPVPTHLAFLSSQKRLIFAFGDVFTSADWSTPVSSALKTYRIGRDYLKIVYLSRATFPTSGFYRAHNALFTDRLPSPQILDSMQFGSFLQSFNFSNDFVIAFMSFLSGICTCTYEQVEEYPASVILSACHSLIRNIVTNMDDYEDYIRASFPMAKVRRVQNGVQEVVSKLVDGSRICPSAFPLDKVALLEPYRVFLNSPVAKIERQQDGLHILYIHSPFQGHVELAKRYSHVILSTPAPITAQILANSPQLVDQDDRLSKEVGLLSRVPYVNASVVVHKDESVMGSVEKKNWKSIHLILPDEIVLNTPGKRKSLSSTSTQTNPARTGFQSSSSEIAMATHYQSFPNGEVIFQTTNPTHSILESKIISSNSFPRARVTCDSLAAVQELTLSMKTRGDRHVWFTGSYLYEGIPLLQGCVESARLVVNATLRK